MNIDRRVRNRIDKAMARQAAVALIGPKQVGKTTLALEISKTRNTLYLDLENSADRRKLEEPTYFLREYADSLVILDEIHRVPNLFQELRGIIDEGIRTDRGKGRFLILGSASMDILNQSGETLAGRIEFVDLHPLDITEVSNRTDDGFDDFQNRLWVRGGYPSSFLADSAEDSFVIRENLIKTYLEREIAQFGRRIPAETMERFWTMLAHGHGTLLSASKLAMNFEKSVPTITEYVDFLVDLLLVRRLRPYSTNLKKRLVKSPKVYIRDSGILHALLGIENFNELAGHPVYGLSWEGFVIENLLSAAPWRTFASFYRTSSGAEIDLVLELPGNACTWAIEVKCGMAPKPSKGFHTACDDIKPDKKFLVHLGTEQYELSNGVTVIGVRKLVDLLLAMQK